MLHLKPDKLPFTWHLTISQKCQTSMPLGAFACIEHIFYLLDFFITFKTQTKFSMLFKPLSRRAWMILSPHPFLYYIACKNTTYAIPVNTAVFLVDQETPMGQQQRPTFLSILTSQLSWVHMIEEVGRELTTEFKGANQPSACQQSNVVETLWGVGLLIPSLGICGALAKCQQHRSVPAASALRPMTQSGNSAQEDERDTVHCIQGS